MKREESGMFEGQTAEAEELAGSDSRGTKPNWESSRVYKKEDLHDQQIDGQNKSWKGGKWK